MAKIRQSNLDNSIVTGLTELTSVASGDQTIIYDASTGTLKKISQTNLLNFPNISSVSPTNVLTGDGTGNATFTITGTGFTGGSASLVNASGSTITFDSVTVNSDTQITGVIAKSSLPGSGEPYDVKVTGGNGLVSTLEDQINIDQSPTFVTASGSLGSERFSMSGIEVNATDPESAGNVTFELQSGSLPPGISLSNTGANGGTATFTGTISPLASSDTVYNFTLRAVDAASNVSSRAFSFTSLGPVTESFTSSGTFSVPTGLSSVDVLVVAGGGGSKDDAGGGGGGAGGLVFVPGFPVTPGGTVSVTVGDGGQSGTLGQWATPFPSPGLAGGGGNGQDSVFGTLTAKGGGGGGAHTHQGNSGGSGGGVGRDSGPRPAGCATQSPQPGQSGAYGFGNPGGTTPATGSSSGGGGGGAGAAGMLGGSPDAPIESQGPSNRSNGGIGKAYTIADGTTPVYYAGGGGGAYQTGSESAGGIGGQGGGGRGGRGDGQNNPSTHTAAVAGQANKGGGAGGGRALSSQAGGTVSLTGGKGIVIVRY